MKALRLAVAALVCGFAAAGAAASPPASPTLGAYRLADGGIASLVFVEGKLRLAEYSSGLYRTLTQASPGLYTGGPGASVPTPVSVRVQLESPTRIAVDGRQATLLPIAQEDVSYRDGPIRLAGRLLRPAGGAPRAGVVVVPGSEPASRTTYDLWSWFYASQGLDVLTYDKRGVGGSGGTYIRAATPANLRNLSSDALAGARFLRGVPGVSKVGLAGASQAGWVIEQAASRSTDVAFALLQSSPAMSVGRQLAYDQLTGQGWKSPGSDQDVQTKLASIADSGYDPRADIAKLHVPVLWQLGSVDRRMFTAETVADLQQIHNSYITVDVYPGGAHSLRQTADGTVTQEQTAPGYVPQVFADIAAWLRAQRLGK
ncbi:MAG: prolyl oligopeptidase family serine peptidase [Actinobacteria bacterium]|nr:prolyl oligopeptidase family serine peptidase [Actinomycetota bacterium]